MKIGHYAANFLDQMKEAESLYELRGSAVQTSSAQMVTDLVKDATCWSISKSAFPLVWHTELSNEILEEVRLPYPVMVIEYDFDYEELGFSRPSHMKNRALNSRVDCDRRMILLNEGDNDFGKCIYITSIFSVMNNGLETWAVAAPTVVVPVKSLGQVQQWFVSDKKGPGFSINYGPEYGISIIPSLPVFKGFSQKRPSDWQKAVSEMGDEIRAALNMLQVLQCDNAPVEVVPPNAKHNNKRAKRGKTRIPTYRTLKVSSHRRREKLSGASSTGICKRAHWRRGHVRNQPTAKGYVKRWIKPTIVGAGNPDKPETVLT